MPRDSKYVAVYDVSDARERRRLAGVLEGFGLRVQESAFEMRLTPAARQTLLRRVEALQLQSGFLYLYRRAGGDDRAAAGRVPEDPLGEDRHAYLLDVTPAHALANRPSGRARARHPAGGSRTGATPYLDRTHRPATPVNPVLPSDFPLPAATDRNHSHRP
jgi:CRISPR/Cas system-associated endoribonuclease Cas2